MSAQNLPLLLRVSLAMFLALQSVSTLAIEQIGPLHPIVEPNMLEEIYRVLNEKEKSGFTAKVQKEAIERSKRSIENPRAVEGLARRDPAQVIKAIAIVKHYNGLVKPIMVAGPPLEMSRKWKTQVYFDQGGALVRKLGIQRVPSLVTQENKKLRIDELEVH